MTVTISLFPIAMLIVFILTGVAFCYEPEIDSPRRTVARPYLSRAQQIDRAIEIELHALRYPYPENRVYARNVRANTIGL